MVILRLTQAGLNAALDAQNNGLTLRLNKIKFGSGKYGVVDNDPRTGMVNPFLSVDFIGGGIEPNSHTLRFNCSFKDTQIRDVNEVGLFTTDNVLFAVASTTGDALFTTSKTLVIVMVGGLKLGAFNSATVEIVLDENGALALQLFGAHESHPNPHPQYALSNDSRISNGQIAYGWGNHGTQGYLKYGDLPAPVDISGKADKTTRLLAGNGITISGNGDLSANRTFSVSYGTTAGTVAQGNDSRINNGQTAYDWGNHGTQGYLKSADLPPGVDISGKYDKTGGLISGNVQIGSDTNPSTRKSLYVTRGLRADSGISSGGTITSEGKLRIEDNSWVQLQTVETSLGISRYVEFTTGTNEYRFDKPISAPNLHNDLGYGQAWQDVTVSRSLNTTYTNSSGKPIAVIVSVAQGSVHSVAFIDGIKISGQRSTYNSGEPIVATSFIVPNGSTYRISTSALEGSLSHWAELR